jgi:hypothetical protein
VEEYQHSLMALVWQLGAPWKSWVRFPVKAAPVEEEEEDESEAVWGVSKLCSVISLEEVTPRWRI